MEKNKEKWLSVFEYARKLNISPQTVYLHIRLGKIPPEKVSKRKKIVERIYILDN